ncbi:hypothetical protein ACQR1I_13755 [Bradyrhizobium sp. HKCCYLS2038]|uniref:hypothetical protein n=1 Tax=unclassified Bradyrhizobium TaxID=2631580 RepID=UPI003EBB5134
MQDAEKSNVVQFRDYARRSVSRPGAEPSGGPAAERGAILAWPRSQAVYPGGIDDLPI